MSTTVPKHFDAETRNRLAQAEEIQIERQQPGTNAPGPRTTIWVVVVGDEVFVRSVRGPMGRWFQAIKTSPTAAVHIDGQRIPVRAVPVSADAMLTRVSDAYRQKYRTSPHLPPLLRDETVPTTLRLEPM